MNSLSLQAAVGSLVALASLHADAQTTDLKKRNPYDSRYLVSVDPESRTILALDFNRTELGDSGRVQFEYKGWEATAGNWRMFLYEDWTQTKPERGWPSRAGLRVEASPAGSLRVGGTGFKIEARPDRFPFDAEKDGTGRIRTAHIETSGTLTRPAVLEWVLYDQSDLRSNAEERAERERSLHAEAFFGRYDWIVLATESGELIQVSQGTQTEDFGYRVRDGKPEEVHDVEVRWLQTERDSKSGRDVPVRWSVDVPTWGLRVELSKLGEHRGHGPERKSSRRPVYRQVSVEGTGRMDGRTIRLFGMVESIQD